MMIYKAKNFSFKKREDRIFDQFFVWNMENIYIMDNHRAALWCWLNEISKKSETNLKVLHIDNHPDMSPKGIHSNCSTNIKFGKMGLKNYLNSQHTCSEYDSTPIFSYENFLRFFIQKYPNNINPEEVFITQHYWKTKPHIHPAMAQSLEKYFGKIETNADCSQLVRRLYKNDLFELFENDQNLSWIIDLDLDYFYNEDLKKLNITLAEEVINQIKKWYDKKKIIALTVAWSPEFLINRETETIKSGLEKAKNLNTLFCQKFNLNFPQL